MLTKHPLFLLETLFLEVKQVLPHKENLGIEALRLLVTDAPGWEITHTVECYSIKAKER